VLLWNRHGLVVAGRHEIINLDFVQSFFNWVLGLVLTAVVLVREVLFEVHLLEVALQVELACVVADHVPQLRQLQAVARHVHEFLVLRVAFEGLDQDSVRKLEAEGVHRAVDDEHLIEWVGLDDAQVLNVDSIGGARAVLLVQAELNQLASRV